MFPPPGGQANMSRLTSDGKDGRFNKSQRTPPTKLYKYLQSSIVTLYTEMPNVVNKITKIPFSCNGVCEE